MANTNIKAGMFHGVIGNGPNGYFLKTNGDGSMTWDEAGTPSPTVTSVTYPGDDTAADPAGGQSVTLTGTSFATGATVTIGGTTAPTVSFVSATELTITTPAKAAGDYDIVVTNTDGGTATFVDGISYNGIPSWTTASGSLGTFASDTTISTITLQASEPDAGTITFNITSGALPTGLSLTGANIDGTTSIETADTLYNFTVTAIDDENQSTPRAFSITVEKWVVPAPENFEIVTYTGNGGTQAITSKIGKAASFNGSSSYIDTSYIVPAIATQSISLWFKTSTTGINQIIYADSPSNGAAVNTRLSLLIQSDNNFRLLTGNDSTFWLDSSISALPYLDGNWHNVIVTISGTTFKLYVNDSLLNTYTSTVSFGTAGNQSLVLGRSGLNPVNYFNGSLDQVRIFNTALNSTQVGQLALETYADPKKSTTDYFGDGSGVALYELDEDANDTGTTPYGTGAIDSGQSAVFNGSSSYINTGISSLSTFSVSMWINDSVLGSGGFFGNWNGTSNDDIFMRTHTDGTLRISFDGFATQYFGTAGDVTVNTWHHVVVTHNSGSINVYLDGSNIGSTTTPNTTFSSGANFYIGDDNSATYFNGKIDQVRIYNTVLSASDVEALVSETNVPTANLVAHYKLDGDATDETGSYNGTPTSITYSDPAEFPLVQYNGTPTNVNFLGMAFQPDLVWVKQRDNTRSHRLTDSVRGANKIILSNDTSQELIRTDEIGSFDSNGFTIGANVGVNDNTGDYVAWCWKAGGAAVLNEEGSIDSQVSANTDAGFSVVSYTGNGIAGATVGHGLNQEPELIIPKNRDEAQSWVVGATAIGKSYILDLANSNAALSRPNQYYYDWNSTTITMGSEIHINGSADKIIAYCFHSVDGYQKVGSYTGTGVANTAIGYTDSNGDGTGTGAFTPRWVMIKRTDAGSSNWFILDSIRDTASPYGAYLLPNASNAENNLDAYSLYFNSNGFTVNSTDVQLNALNGTYIYLAIA